MTNTPFLVLHMAGASRDRVRILGFVPAGCIFEGKAVTVDSLVGYSESNQILRLFEADSYEWVDLGSLR